MGQPHKVAAKFFRPTKQRARVVFAMGATWTIERLFVHIDSPQEYCLSVEQYVRPAYFDRAKANVVNDLIGFGRDFHAIEFWLFRRP